MNHYIHNVLLRSTGAEEVVSTHRIQSLWSGYGELLRLHLLGGVTSSVILKHIRPPTNANNDIGHARKLHSYHVELSWCRDWSRRCGTECRVPHCYGTEMRGDERLLILEDLDAAGFDLRKSHLSKDEVKLCLHWLAHFHATFMNETPEGLWPIGSYWHLATRPDELATLQHPQLKTLAAKIDMRLNSAHYQTIIHGDAKADNFCFGYDGRVAAVDFQYVGGGCGMKDVAYLFDSALSNSECTAWCDELLEYYFAVLRQALPQLGKTVDWQALESEWRRLYPFAWADYCRFLLGWGSVSQPINTHAQSLITQLLDELKAPEVTSAARTV